MTDSLSDTSPQADEQPPPPQEQPAEERPAATGDDPATEEQPAVRGLERRGGGVRRFFGNARIAWAVAILALALALVAGMQWADLYAAEQQRTAVREDARALALELTTFDGADIEQWLQRAQARATGDYAEQLTALFDQNLRDALRESQAVSRGEVTQVFVQEIDGDQAQVFVLARQTITNAQTEDPVQDELRMDITMERGDQRWLASDVAILGPPGLSGGVPAPAPEVQPEGEEGGG